MKRTFKKITSVLYVFLAISQTATAADQVVNRSVSDKGKCCKKVLCADLVKAKKVWTERLDVEKDCKACRTITKEDFLHDGYFSKTFVIDKPGKYCLGENIPFEPQDPSAVAILIDASDVKLDLCCNKLRQDNNEFGVKGIELVAGNDNITITNGTVCGFQGCAIFAEVLDAATLLPPNPFTTEAAGSSTIIVNQPGHGLMTGDVVEIFRAQSFNEILSLNINGQHTITVLDANNYTIDVSPSKAAGDGVSGGGSNVRVVDKFTNQTTLSNICLTDLNIINNGHGSGLFGPCAGGAGGAGLVICTGISFFSNVSDVPSVQSRFAYNNVVVRQCKINNNSHGALAIFPGDNVVIEDTQMNGTFVDTGFEDVRSLSLPLSRNITVHQCQINDTTQSNPLAIFSHPFGFFVSGSRCVVFQDVEICNVFGESSIFIWSGEANLSNFVMENCKFDGVRGGDFSSLIGFLHLSDFQDTPPDNIDNGWVIRNCTFNNLTRSENGQALAPTLEVLVPINIYPAANIVIESNQFSNIGTNNPRFTNLGAIGILDINEDTFFPGSGQRNWTIKNNVISDVFAAGRNNALTPIIPGISPDIGIAGILIHSHLSTLDGIQPRTTNINIENNVIQRMTDETSGAVGIYVGMYDLFQGAAIDRGNSPASIFQNVQILNNCITDVHGAPETPSAGIYMGSVHRPVICNNVINDCDTAILFTGTNLIWPDHIFQLAPTQQDALDVANGLKPSAPPFVVDLTNLGTGMQDFNNLTQGNTVTIDASSGTFVRLAQNSINTTPTDLNDLNWQAGDPILYDANGGDVITDLVDSTTYFAVVFVPGFTECGLVQENKATNCGVAGYRDDREPTTTAWVSNVAVKNGPTPDHDENYVINWPLGTPQVDEGTLGAYPDPGRKYFNLSLIPN